MINIICVGKIKEKSLSNIIADYYLRISNYHKIKIIELKDENDIEKESQKIIKYMDENHYNILFDINGKMLDSKFLAQTIDDLFTKGNSTINFIIGGSDGVNKTVKEKANLIISMSLMTFPHGLFRAILLEQIYRSFKILNNETYHK